MPAADQGTERTETATQWKRQQARNKGQVARSADLTTSMVLLAAGGMMWLWGGRIAEFLATSIASLEEARPQLTRDGVVGLYRFYLRDLATTVLPFMLVLFAVAIFANLMQFGLVLSGDPLVPKFEKINPVAGFKRIFSIRGLVKLGVSVLKMIAVVGLAVWFCWGHLMHIVSSVGLGAKDLGRHLGSLAIEFALVLGVALFVLGLLDFLFQRWKHEQDLKMTKQEVRDEVKEQEGDPHFKQRRKEAHQQLSVARDLQKVPEADVVITNPTELAIAIKYDPQTMPAPIVVAKGADLIAARIREIAAAHGIPIIERKPLAQQLFKQVRTGQPIPTDLYDVFVEILAYVYRVTGRPLPEF